MSSKSDDTSDSDWRTREHRERDIAQARALKDQARQGGLRFEVFLPPDLAGWILDLVERGVFVDPAKPYSSSLASSGNWSRTPIFAERY